MNRSLCKVNLMSRMLLLVALLVLPVTSVLATDKAGIDASVAAALAEFRKHSPTAATLVDKAAGVLVFPDVIKMGFGVGGEFGEGVLLVNNEPEAYYAIAGASFGLQMGVQFKAEMILFMTEEALAGFRRSRGWKVGVDGSVALLKLGAEGRLDTMTANQPIIGFIFSNRGLMYNLTLEGNKITKIKR
jgi:lipid-binding SYLF domain-containing protein